MDTATTPLDRRPRNAKTQQEKSMEGLGMKAQKTESGTVMSSSKAVTRRPAARKNKDKNSMLEFDPQLSAAFQRNFMFLQRIFSLDTYLRVLPPGIAQSLGRSLGFFTRIFTQFWDPRGIKNAQTAMGIRKRESRVQRRLRDKEEEE